MVWVFFGFVYDETLPEFLQVLCFVFINFTLILLLANVLGYINIAVLCMQQVLEPSDWFVNVVSRVNGADWVYLH